MVIMSLTDIFLIYILLLSDSYTMRVAYLLHPRTCPSVGMAFLASNPSCSIPSCRPKSLLAVSAGHPRILVLGQYPAGMEIVAMVEPLPGVPLVLENLPGMEIQVPSQNQCPCLRLVDSRRPGCQMVEYPFERTPVSMDLNFFMHLPLPEYTYLAPGLSQSPALVVRPHLPTLGVVPLSGVPTPIVPTRSGFSISVEFFLLDSETELSPDLWAFAT